MAICNNCEEEFEPRSIFNELCDDCEEMDHDAEDEEDEDEE